MRLHTLSTCLHTPFGIKKGHRLPLTQCSCTESKPDRQVRKKTSISLSFRTLLRHSHNSHDHYPCRLHDLQGPPSYSDVGLQVCNLGPISAYALHIPNWLLWLPILSVEEVGG